MNLRKKFGILVTISLIFLLVYLYFNVDRATPGNSLPSHLFLQQKRIFKQFNDLPSSVAEFPADLQCSFGLCNKTLTTVSPAELTTLVHKYKRKRKFRSRKPGKTTTTSTNIIFKHDEIQKEVTEQKLQNTGPIRTSDTISKKSGKNIVSRRKWFEGTISGLSSVLHSNLTFQDASVVNVFSGKRFPPYVIETTGTFLERLHAYNIALSQLSKAIQEQRGYKEWQDVRQPNELSVIWGRDDDFLDQLSDHVEVATLILPWMISSKTWAEWKSMTDSTNLLVGEYFEWSASEPLCIWIKTQGFTKAHYDAVFDHRCNSEIRLMKKPQSLEWLYFHAKPVNVNHYWPNNGSHFPRHFYISPPLSVLYINVLQDAIINLVGDVISGGVKVVPFTCSHDYIPTIPIEYQESPVYREVFVITQFWGTSYFHKMVEVMPRIAPYLEFLRSRPHIQIHAPEDHSQVSEFLQVLDINSERIVTGVIRAKVAYLPQGTACGFPNVHEIQLLSLHFRNYIRKNLPAEPRNRLVLIQRSGWRRFIHHQEIETAVKAIAHSNNLTFTLFSDRPVATLHATMSIFNSASVIVAPHGAGLSNMIYSEPKTLVIEGVCNPPHVNLCYLFLAHDLGHRYHGIPSERGCEEVLTISPETIATVLEELIRVNRF